MGATLPFSQRPMSWQGKNMPDLFMEHSAEFSPCRTYRYVLWRIWGGSTGYAMFIGLNPSTADETTNDPTVRRCIAYAKYWGYSGLCMTNLFAYRATDPAEMRRAVDPVGPDNNDWLRDAGSLASVIVAAWGCHGRHHGRDLVVRQMFPQLTYLRLTKDGHPAHPLYLPKTLMPRPWLNGTDVVIA